MTFSKRATSSRGESHLLANCGRTYIRATVSQRWLSYFANRALDRFERSAARKRFYGNLGAVLRNRVAHTLAGTLLVGCNEAERVNKRQCTVWFRLTFDEQGRSFSFLFIPLSSPNSPYVPFSAVFPSFFTQANKFLAVLLPSLCFLHFGLHSSFRFVVRSFIRRLVSRVLFRAFLPRFDSPVVRLWCAWMYLAGSKRP